VLHIAWLAVWVHTRHVVEQPPYPADRMFSGTGGLRAGILVLGLLFMIWNQWRLFHDLVRGVVIVLASRVCSSFSCGTESQRIRACDIVYHNYLTLSWLPFRSIARS
jgi:hypothetical protein